MNLPPPPKLKSNLPPPPSPISIGNIPPPITTPASLPPPIHTKSGISLPPPITTPASLPPPIHTSSPAISRVPVPSPIAPKPIVSPNARSVIPQPNSRSAIPSNVISPRSAITAPPPHPRSATNAPPPHTRSAIPTPNVRSPGLTQPPPPNPRSATNAPPPNPRAAISPPRNVVSPRSATNAPPPNPRAAVSPPRNVVSPRSATNAPPPKPRSAVPLPNVISPRSLVSPPSSHAQNEEDGECDIEEEAEECEPELTEEELRAIQEAREKATLLLQTFWRLVKQKRSYKELYEKRKWTLHSKPTNVIKNHATRNRVRGPPRRNRPTRGHHRKVVSKQETKPEESEAQKKDGEAAPKIIRGGAAPMLAFDPSKVTLKKTPKPTRRRKSVDENDAATSPTKSPFGEVKKSSRLRSSTDFKGPVLLKPQLNIPSVNVPQNNSQLGMLPVKSPKSKRAEKPQGVPGQFNLPISPKKSKKSPPPSPSPGNGAPPLPLSPKPKLSVGNFPIPLTPPPPSMTATKSSPTVLSSSSPASVGSISSTTTNTILSPRSAKERKKKYNILNKFFTKRATRDDLVSKGILSENEFQELAGTTDGSNSLTLTASATTSTPSKSKVCENKRCQKKLRNRKNCKNCKRAFCGNCLTKKCKIPSLGYNKMVHVCPKCYFEIQNNATG